MWYAVSDIADPTTWTDREREFFALGWNECLKVQPGENARLRAALKEVLEVWPNIAAIRQIAERAIERDGRSR